MDISPDKQNIDRVFSNTNYYIDFYQREYKWTKPQVISLLDDIFYKFNLEYNADLEPNEKNINTLYSWYYLSTYITNKSEGKSYVVDGQQRLTTLTLILIKLFQLCNSEKFQSSFNNWVQTKIMGFSASGEEFWMGHDKRKKTLSALFRSDDLKTVDTTEGLVPKIWLLIMNLFQIILKRICRLDTNLIHLYCIS